MEVGPSPSSQMEEQDGGNRYWVLTLLTLSSNLHHVSAHAAMMSVTLGVKNKYNKLFHLYESLALPSSKKMSASPPVGMPLTEFCPASTMV